MLNMQAPDFSLQASNGKHIRLSDLSSFVVLLFYPKNEAPTCNHQLGDLNINLEEFLKLNTLVFGVNTAPVEKQRQYCTRRRLEFPILSDPGGSVAKQFKAHMRWLPFNKRTVVVIDPQGTICFYQRGLPSVQAILDTIVTQTSVLNSLLESCNKL